MTGIERACSMSWLLKMFLLVGLYRGLSNNETFEEIVGRQG